MRRALFGKLQAKRDFVAPGAPREFLLAWEPWLQSGVSASRVALGAGWRDAYLTMPIWRFWLGAEICGAPAIGALMPSMDGVGRYFPLTIVFMSDGSEAPAPPELDPNDDWFASVEEFLLATLEPDSAFDDTLAALDRLAEPARARSGLTAQRYRDVTLASVNGGFSNSFALLRQDDAARAHAASSFWWTSGGGGFARYAFTAHRLPDPAIFSDMMTGQFAEARPTTGAAFS